VEWTMSATKGRSLSCREILVGIEGLSWKGSRGAGTGLEAATYATFVELQRVADGVVGLLSVRVPIVRAAVA
jgi:hypothetical protein